jgi:hypothetical protein
MKAPWQPPPDLDKECLALCVALNKVPGVQTIGSCCGHGRRPYRIFFVVSRLDALALIAYEARHATRDDCHHDDWRVFAYTDCDPFAPIRFRLEGPPGDYSGAERMAASVEQHVPKPRRRRTVPAALKLT